VEDEEEGVFDNPGFDFSILLKCNASISLPNVT